MRLPVRQLPGPRRNFELMDDDKAYKDLAITVIVQAIKDIREFPERHHVHASAYSFLQGSQEYFFWCGVANINGEYLRDRVFPEGMVPTPFQIQRRD